MTYLLIIVGILLLAAVVFFLVPTFSKDNRFVTEAGSQDLTNFKKLLKAGADPNTVGFMGLTPLICAVQNKRKDNVLFLLDNGADPKGSPGKQSPLTCAIDENDLEIAEILLKAGAMPNQPGMFGRSAMADATLEGKAEFVELLLRYGATLDEKWPDADGLFFRLLPDAVGEKNPERAAKLREVVRIYLDHGASPDARQADGTPALSFAMKNPSILRLLVDRGANTDITWQGIHLKQIIDQLLA